MTSTKFSEAVAPAVATKVTPRIDRPSRRMVIMLKAPFAFLRGSLSLALLVMFFGRGIVGR